MSLQKLADPAHIGTPHPIALQLRNHETLVTIATEMNSTISFARLHFFKTRMRLSGKVSKQIVAALALFFAQPGSAWCANLITNASLETANASGTAPASHIEGRFGTNTATFVYPAPPHTGSRALEIQMSSWSSGDAKLCVLGPGGSRIAVKPGQIYRFSDFYSSDVQTFVTVDFQLNDGSDQWVDIATPAAVSAYSNKASTVAEFVAPEKSVTAMVCHGLRRVGSLQLDDFSLTRITGFTIPPIAPPVDGNLFPNGSAELGSGTPTGWSRGRAGTNTAAFSYITTSGFDGKRMVRTTISNFISGDAKQYPAPVAVTAGDVCTFSDTVKSNIRSFVTFAYNVGSSPFYNSVATLHPSLAPQGFTKTFSVPGGANTFTVFHRIAGVGTIAADDFKLVCNAPPPDPTLFARGMVTFTLDDGFYKQPVNGGFSPDQFQTALPILDTAGLKASMYIVTGYFGFPGYVSQDQVMQMLAKGYEVAAHTVHHCDLVTRACSDGTQDPLTASQEITQSRQTLIDIGSYPWTFAYPFGSYNDQVVQQVASAGFTGARTTDAGAAVDRGDDHYTLRRLALDDTTLESDVKAAIDSAVTNHLWLILVIHHVNTSTDSSQNGHPHVITPTFLQHVVDYVVQKKVRVVTTAQGVQMMAP